MKTFLEDKTTENMQQVISVMHRGSEETETKLVTMTGFIKFNYKRADFALCWFQLVTSVRTYVKIHVKYRNCNRYLNSFRDNSPLDVPSLEVEAFGIMERAGIISTCLISKPQT